MGGVYRGAGRQKIASVFNFIGYYVIGLPIGIPLALVVGMGGIGMTRHKVTIKEIEFQYFYRNVDWIVIGCHHSGLYRIYCLGVDFFLSRKFRRFLRLFL